MVWIRTRRGWEIDGRAVTDESRALGRRRFLETVGLAGAGALGALAGIPLPAIGAEEPRAEGFDPEVRRTLPARTDDYRPERNPAFGSGDRSVTREEIAASYNNYYEFTTDKAEVWRLAERLETRPWTVEIGGLVKKPRTFDLDDLLRMQPLEERVYRMRCVEAWSMVVPWAGLPLRELLERVEPTSKATHLRLLSFVRPRQAIGQQTQPWYEWPYYEGLRRDEAMNELTLMATGIYGHPLPGQHGAPVRLVVPWKYGFKSIKGIVKIELVDREPPTFWNDLAPQEYDFLANVDPAVPHPRWSQATERDIGTGDRIPTRKFNGYGEQVAGLYE